ncbi:lysosomal thioesterase PPT2-A-like [Acanthochromis polyacanthus]|uniref:lysosomal thioesterase PPT2-A-like n=1 Tax=Acanthochromis polyacanthus TaxID=80966 RepID=UPI002233FC7A|nr:lysosomal thioesterase PPT2-A-like [Acanthochromis polyacanthus]
MMETLQVLRGSLLLLLLVAGVCTERYKPVIIVHGLFEGPRHYRTFSQYIRKAHPDTQVTTISLYNHAASIKPLWMQVKGFMKALTSIMNKSPDGIHLLCYSQGGVICRALLSTIPNHNVHTFIALSSPLAGHYGETEYQSLKFGARVKTEVRSLCYNRLGQLISICNYWKDPHHMSKYRQYNSFLPLLDGEKPHKHMEAWKINFLRIKKLVLIGGPDDGVITPWQSSLFGFYDSNENVVEMRNQEFYKKDNFGLKTLDDRGDVSVCVRAGVKHTEWHFDYTVFSNCIEKWLT